MEDKEVFTIISVRAPSALRDGLERLARAEKRSISNYVALVLERHVAAKAEEKAA